MTGHIAPGLLPLAVPVSQLVLDPRNARKHDERNLDAIKDSLARFGQRLPLVVQKQGMVVRAGNGRLRAALALGWDSIAAVVVDESDAEAAAFALADNRTAELAEWDWQQLAETLANLKVELPEFSAEQLGWNDTELDGLSMAGAWDELEDARLAAAGDRTRVDRSSLVLRFTNDEAEQLGHALQRLGIGADVTAEAVLAMAAKC